MPALQLVYSLCSGSGHKHNEGVLFHHCTTSEENLRFGILTRICKLTKSKKITSSMPIDPFIISVGWTKHQCEFQEIAFEVWKILNYKRKFLKFVKHNISTNIRIGLKGMAVVIMISNGESDQTLGVVSDRGQTLDNGGWTLEKSTTS